MFPKKVNELQALEFVDKYFPDARDIFKFGYSVYGKDGPFYIREDSFGGFVYGNTRSFAETLHNGTDFNVVYYDCDKIFIGYLQ